VNPESSGFKDHFSRQSADYAKFRPQYPRELFQWIAAQAPDDQLAVDCATGNGQAALGLAEFFRRVIGLDASAKQIESAQPDDRVEYRVAPAETTGLPESYCDVVTVAQALHWFDLDKFYAEAKRILKPDGVLAVWAYNYLRISPEIDAVLHRYHDEIVGPFWPPERKIVGRGYRDLPFPFAEIAAPDLCIETRWTLAHLLGYLSTWSATQRYRAEKGQDPLTLIENDLVALWGNAETERSGVWPLVVRLGHSS
jgi:SAM-dependent methyltransferase